MRKIFILMIVIVSVSAFGQAQEKLKIGEVKNGKLTVTNIDVLRAFFIDYLGKSGTLGKDLQLSYSPDKSRVFAHYPVSGNKNKVTCVGVMLVYIDNEAYIVPNAPNYAPGGPGGGGSVTITCIGNPCEDCEMNITWPSGSWIPDVSCSCDDADGHCNMSISYTVNVNVGLY